MTSLTTADGFSIEVGGKKKARRSVEGLNRIFDRYRFTAAENTPLEEDVALDPELLGLVFENLLAEIDDKDEAAAESARKASGSYYTPRRIVDCMVNEALHLHLRTEFEKKNATPRRAKLTQGPPKAAHVGTCPQRHLLAKQTAEEWDAFRQNFA
ncbi:MAG: hypothetical protein WC076_09115, partial [Terrimicrobiaceae bacterium]